MLEATDHQGAGGKWGFLWGGKGEKVDCKKQNVKKKWFSQQGMQQSIPESDNANCIGPRGDSVHSPHGCILRCSTVPTMQEKRV